MAMRQLRIGWLRKRYLMFGMMAKKPIPQHIVDAWFDAGLRDKRIRQRPDQVRPHEVRRCANWCGPPSGSTDFHGDVLVLWSHNPVMPDAHAAELTELTRGRLQYVDDANVLIMLDQPEQTARAIGAFLTG